MPLSFPNLATLHNLWGRPPGLRGSPWTRSLVRKAKAFGNCEGPTRASAAVQGDRPTIYAGVRLWNK